jgi:regulator of nonsense transcripts 2
MDIEFLIQDTFALTRSNWKLAATFEEAWLAFAELTRGYYKTQESDKNTEVEAQEDDASSEEDGEDDDLQVPDMDDARSSTDDAEIEVRRKSQATIQMLMKLPACVQWRLEAWI